MWTPLWWQITPRTRLRVTDVRTTPTTLVIVALVVLANRLRISLVLVRFARNARPVKERSFRTRIRRLFRCLPTLASPR